MPDKYFSIALKTENLRFLIVGTGESGQKIAQMLLAKRPDLSPKIIPEKNYQASDLEETDVLIIATESFEQSHVISRTAQEHGCLIYTAAQQVSSDFCFDGILVAQELPQFEKHETKTRAGLGYVRTQGVKVRQNKRLVFRLAALFLLSFIGCGLANLLPLDTLWAVVLALPHALYGMVGVGFMAQLVDGAVGLGYGVTCATSMMLLGIKLPAISGGIHTAEMFSSAISGYSHYKFGNVNQKLLRWLAASGVLGAVAGASLLVYVGTRFESITYAILSGYTALIGIRLLFIAFQKNIVKGSVRYVGLLGFVGGFFDAFGGGGWGPIVSSTLLAKGRKSQYVVGTVSMAEFFVTFSASLVFFSTLGISHWPVVLGLIIGGSLAAPIAARLSGKIPQKVALSFVAFLVILFSIRVFMKI